MGDFEYLQSIIDNLGIMIQTKEKDFLYPSKISSFYKGLFS